MRRILYALTAAIAAALLLTIPSSRAIAQNIGGGLIRVNGQVYAYLGNGTAAAPSLTFASRPTNGFYFAGTQQINMSLVGAQAHVWEPGNYYIVNNSATIGLGTASDVLLTRDAANAFALRNATNGQTFRLYNTYTDASNYERGFVRWGSNILDIGTEAAGTGTGRSLRFLVNNSLAVTIAAADNGATFTNKVVSTSPTAGVGYATGAGGTVTQLTSKATGVTLNTASGQITLNNAALAAAAKVSFVVTDSAVTATDNLIVSIASGGTANAYRANVTAIAAGSFTVTVENITAGSLSEAPIVTFSVLKGATS